MEVDLGALKQLEAERNISFEQLIEMIERALLSAYHKTPYNVTEARAEVDRENGHVTIWATEYDREGNDLGEYDDTPEGFGHIASATARQIIRQSFREDDNDEFVSQHQERQGQLLSGVVQNSRGTTGNWGVVEISFADFEGVLPPSEQTPGEDYSHNKRFRVVITDISKGFKGPIVTVSRTHPLVVQRLFELEVPEIADGTVQIKSISREAGHRSKIAVATDMEGLNPTGTSIGERGTRVRAVMNELGEEKIDIINYSDDPKKYIAEALSPATVSKVDIINEEERTARVTVPESALSLAIGKEGQNARLAAKLTGWKIDILTDTEAARLPKDTPNDFSSQK